MEPGHNNCAKKMALSSVITNYITIYTKCYTKDKPKYHEADDIVKRDTIWNKQ